MRKEFTYEINVINDWDTSESYFFSDAIEAVNAWNKFTDLGDAIKERSISFIPPSGQISVKTLYAK